MNGNVLFSAARLPAPSLPPSVCILRVSSVQRCSQLFPFLTLELSRAAFILPPQHTSSPMETPPRYDCFHTFMCFKQNTAENCLLILSGESSLTKQFAVDGGMWRHPLLPALHLMLTLMLTPSKPGPPAPVPSLLSISDEADFSVSQTLIT